MTTAQTLIRPVLSSDLSDREAIDQLALALNEVDGHLNQVLIEHLGEAADWSNHAGDIRIPQSFGEQPEWLHKIWFARESANSALAWVDEHHNPAKSNT